jgi:hypothetical protein
MISGQTLRVCPEGKPVPTFPDHALGIISAPMNQSSCIMKIIVSLIFVMISSTAFAATSEKYGMGG